MYDLFENEADQTAECNFIESIRFGAYDENGVVSSAASSGSSWDAEVTIGQKVALGISIGICVIFIIYACYLHHSMTNLLIKSLSHRELLPQSRKGRSPSKQRGRANSSSSKRGKVADDPDWDSGNAEAA